MRIEANSLHTMKAFFIILRPDLLIKSAHIIHILSDISAKESLTIGTLPFET